MKISLQELHDMQACKAGIERFQLQTNGALEPVDVVTLIGGHNTYADLLWLANKTLSKDKIVQSIRPIVPPSTNVRLALIRNCLDYITIAIERFAKSNKSLVNATFIQMFSSIETATLTKLQEAERRSIAKCNKLRTQLNLIYPHQHVLARMLRENLRQELCCLVTIQRELSKYEY